MKLIMAALPVVVAAALFSTATGAPTSREGKSIGYYDYLQPVDYNNYDLQDENDFMAFINNENDASTRALPNRKYSSNRNNNNQQQFNSPIYYIRLPPQPYMFVPGLGYISQPPQQHSAMSQLVNLPVSFVTNGKPSTIYQWTAGLDESPSSSSSSSSETANNLPTKPIKPQKPNIQSDSTVHKLQGQYNFNGKPEDIFVLRDSYNSLYGDALQNFYP